VRTLLLATLLLAGCATPPAVLPEPPVAACPDACSLPCDTAVPPWIPPDPKSSDAWTYIRPQVVDPLKAKADACEIRRAACSACLDRLREEGVIR
jgi:hypothetical protein